jgi:hypothetical protein
MQVVFKIIFDKHKSLLSFHSAYSTVEQCYLSLPEDMVEDTF